PKKRFLGLILADIQYLIRDFAVEVSRQNNDVFLVLFDDFPINSRYIIKALGIGDRRHLRKIVIAFFGFRKQYDLVAVIFPGAIFMIVANIEFAAYNRLDFSIGDFFAGFNSRFYFG